MCSEVAWIQLSSGTQVWPQIILDLDYFPDDLSVSFNYVLKKAGVVLEIEGSVRRSIKGHFFTKYDLMSLKRGFVVGSRCVDLTSVYSFTIGKFVLSSVSASVFSSFV